MGVGESETKFIFFSIISQIIQPIILPYQEWTPGGIFMPG